MIFKQPDLNKLIQLRLIETGLYEGKVDGIMGKGSREALSTFLNDSFFLSPIAGDNKLVKLIQLKLNELDDAGLTTDGLMGHGTVAALTNYGVKYNRVHERPLYNVAYSKHVNQSFIDLVVDWIKIQQYPAEFVNYVMSVMYFESGGTFSPSKQNMGGSNAFGLLQFMAPAAQDLGYSLDEIKNMRQEEQLIKCVFPYFELNMKRYGRFKSLSDFYFAVLRPASIGKSDDSVLFTRGTKAYAQNAGLDTNRNGYITVREISERIYQVYYNGMLPIHRSEK